MKKNLIGVGPFDILRSRVILLQNKCLTENLEIQLDFDRSELQKICLHEEVVELMSSHKHGEKRFTVSNGRICLGCGLKELVNGMNGRFYRILLGHSFFAKSDKFKICFSKFKRFVG